MATYGQLLQTAGIGSTKYDQVADVGMSDFAKNFADKVYKGVTAKAEKEETVRAAAVKESKDLIDQLNTIDQSSIGKVAQDVTPSLYENVIESLTDGDEFDLATYLNEQIAGTSGAGMFDWKAGSNLAAINAKARTIMSDMTKTVTQLSKFDANWATYNQPENYEKVSKDSMFQISTIRDVLTKAPDLFANNGGQVSIFNEDGEFISRRQKRAFKAFLGTPEANDLGIHSKQDLKDLFTMNGRPIASINDVWDNLNLRVDKEVFHNMITSETDNAVSMVDLQTTTPKYKGQYLDEDKTADNIFDLVQTYETDKDGIFNTFHEQIMTSQFKTNFDLDTDVLGMFDNLYNSTTGDNALNSELAELPEFSSLEDFGDFKKEIIKAANDNNTSVLYEAKKYFENQASNADYNDEAALYNRVLGTSGPGFGGEHFLWDKDDQVSISSRIKEKINLQSIGKNAAAKHMYQKAKRTGDAKFKKTKASGDGGGSAWKKISTNPQVLSVYEDDVSSNKIDFTVAHLQKAPANVPGFAADGEYAKYDQIAVVFKDTNGKYWDEKKVQEWINNADAGDTFPGKYELVGVASDEIETLFGSGGTTVDFLDQGQILNALQSSAKVSSTGGLSASYNLLVQLKRIRAEKQAGISAITGDDPYGLNR